MTATVAWKIAIVDAEFDEFTVYQTTISTRITPCSPSASLAAGRLFRQEERGGQLRRRSIVVVET